MKISYQGVEGCYSYIVCNRLFPNCSYIGCDTFTDAESSTMKLTLL